MEDVKESQKSTMANDSALAFLQLESPVAEGVGQEGKPHAKECPLSLEEREKRLENREKELLQLKVPSLLCNVVYFLSVPSSSSSL